MLNQINETHNFNIYVMKNYNSYWLEENNRHGDEPSVIKNISIMSSKLKS